jgi:hypothetical protein
MAAGGGMESEVEKTAGKSREMPSLTEDWASVLRLPGDGMANFD